MAEAAKMGKATLKTFKYPIRSPMNPQGILKRTRLIIVAEKTRPKCAYDRFISFMIWVTLGAGAKSNRCERNAMTKEKEIMTQRYLLMVVTGFSVSG
jgi:hypothetical protein